MSTQILLVEDDPELSELIAEYLRGEGWEVETAFHGESALERVTRPAAPGCPALGALVLDVMLPGISGFEVLRRLRAGEEAGTHLPVIMLTARGDEVDRVLGLELGADDYLPKPFSSRELAARLRAILRRTGHAEESATPSREREATLRVGDLVLDVNAHVVTRGEVALELTALEFRLLEMLLRRAGTVVTREQIAEEVLGRPLLTYDRSVDTHMSNLRKKLAKEGEEYESIKTLRGTGYMFAVPAAGSSASGGP